MEIKWKPITHNETYTHPSLIEIKGIVLHSIGTPQPNAEKIINQFDSFSAGASCHAVVDGLTGEAYQCLPWNYRGWHCGVGEKGSANANYIGVETGEPDCIKYVPNSGRFEVLDEERAKTIATIAYWGAVNLFAYLCQKFGLNPADEGVIISHKEAHDMGIASNHVDPTHLWTGLNLPFTMNGFRSDVLTACHELNYYPDLDEDEMDAPQYYRVQVGAYSYRSNAERMMKKLKDAGFPTYMVYY